MNLMLDECNSSKKLRTALESIPTINVCSSVDCGFQKGTGDAALIYRRRSRNKILLTKNIEDINERIYPPCGHRGIIVFNEQNLQPDYVVPRIKALYTLKLEGKIQKHVTKIYDDRIEVHTLEGKIERSFSEHEKTKRIGR